MSVRKLDGTPTLGGNFWWKTTYTEKEFKIQHHKTKFMLVGIKPYRLLDPDDHLIATADTEEEIRLYLDKIILH